MRKQKMNNVTTQESSFNPMIALTSLNPLKGLNRLSIRARALIAAAGAAMLGVSAASVIPVTAYAAPGQEQGEAQSQNADPALTQVVVENEQIAPAGTPVEISSGHVDMGPKMIDGAYTLMARDDTSATPTWRHVEDIVFRVSDKAAMELPSDDSYSFIHGDAKVWTIPQQEIAGVVWLGWNTQDPALISAINGGVSLIYGGHQGEGNFYTFVQAGNFSGPQQLWNSEKEEAQPIHVDPNTHTHANWVFTTPGIHLVRVTAQAQLADGSTVEDTRVLRFAVGGSTDAQQALETQWTQETAPAQPAEVEQPSAVDSSANVPLMIGAGLILAALAVLVGVLLGRRKTSSVQAQAAEKMEQGYE